MSVHVTSPTWKHSTAAGNALLVQLSLADQANDDGWCWPGQKSIVARTRLSRATVQRCLYLLASSCPRCPGCGIEHLGEIEIHPREGTSNKYRVTPGGSVLWYTQTTLAAPVEGTPQGEVPQDEAPHSCEAGGCLTAVRRGCLTGDAQNVTEPSDETSLLAATAWSEGTSHPEDWAPLRRPWVYRTPDGRRDLMFDAVVEVCRLNPADETKQSRSYLNRFVEELRATGATPTEVRLRAGRYPERAGGRLTPSSLSKWWPKLGDIDVPKDVPKAVRHIHEWGPHFVRTDIEVCSVPGCPEGTRPVSESAGGVTGLLDSQKGSLLFG